MRAIRVDGRLAHCLRSFSAWLNLIEGFFSKRARSVLRHIRVDSKEDLMHRIHAAIADINREPVVHTWNYKIAAVQG